MFLVFECFQPPNIHSYLLTVKITTDFNNSLQIIYRDGTSGYITRFDF